MTEPSNPETAPEARPRTRRALLGAALGAGAAVAANAIARPMPAAATVSAMSTGQENVADAVTGLVRTTGVALYVSNATQGSTVSGGTFTVIDSQSTAVGITETGQFGWGINLTATGSDAIGIGIEATGANAKGMQVDGGAIGIQVSAQTDGGIGVEGDAFGPGSIGVNGYGAVGVQGDAQSGSGIGVKGTATTGTGGQFSATTGTALQATGKVKLNRSGKSSIGAGKTYVDVTVSGGLTTSALCFATLRTYRSGVHVAAVTPNTTTGKIRIRLNKVASSTSSTPVSWLVLS